MIYLDNAATSFIKPPDVYRAVYRSMMTASSPGRGAHKAAMRAADIVFSCREEAASLFHMDDPTRVVFTSNATHALNIAIHSLVKPHDPVLISGFEHNAVTRPLRAAGAEIRVAGTRLFDREDTLRRFREKISGARLVVCTHVSNVFGYILPIEEIAALCMKWEIPLVIDASQSAGILDIDMPMLGAAFIAMPGHKALFGPQGTGVLLCGSEGKPLMQGGAGFDSENPYMPDALPERLEAGTMNVPGIAGLLEGIRFVRKHGCREIASHEDRLLRELITRMRETNGLHLFSSDEGNQTGILSFQASDVGSEELCDRLSQKGIAVRGGLHCAPLAHKSAGTSEAGTVRVSLSPFTEEKDISAFITALKACF